MTRIGRWTTLALVLLLAGAAAPAEPVAPGYKVVKKLSPGGEGGWDYLTIDGAARRLYITRSNRVMVVDVDKGTLVGEVTGLTGIHGVALVPKRGRGFVSNGGDSTVAVFDLDTLKEVNRVKVGMRPDAIVYDPASNRVFSLNGGGRSATAIDAETEKVAGTIDLGGKPEFAVADGKGQVFVNLEDKSELLALDTHDLKVAHRWPVAPGKDPAGLAIDRAHRRLFSTCHNQMMVVLDADTGQVVAQPAIGRGTDACAFDPDTGLAFSSNGDGTLTVVREDSKGGYEVAETVKTEPGARTMALDPKTHDIYLVTARPKAGERRAYEPGTFTILQVQAAATRRP